MNPPTLGRTPRLILAALLLAGCATDHARDADAYKRVLGGDAVELNLAADAPLRLGDAMALANAHNERLAVEGENYVQALIDKRRAASQFLPTIGLSPGYARQDRFYTAGSPGTPPDRDTFDTSAGLEWNVFNGYRDVANLYRAAATIEQRRAILLDFQSTILLEVTDAFYSALAAERAEEVLTASLKVQEERMRDIRARQQAGVARPLDVSQTESQASSTRVSLISAGNIARNSRAALQLLIHAPVGARKLEDDYTLPADPLSLEAWRTRALISRQDLLAAAAAVEAARQQVEQAFGQYYPTVTLNLETMLTVDNAATEAQWAGVLRANVPLFTAGRIDADVRTAWSALRQAKLLHEYTRRLVERDVEVAFENWNSSSRRLDELHIQFRAGQDAFTQADKSYNVGLATNLERLIAQDTLLSTELQLVTEDLLHRRAHLALVRAVGELTPRTIPTTQPSQPPPAWAPAR